MDALRKRKADAWTAHPGRHTRRGFLVPKRIKRACDEARASMQARAIQDEDWPSDFWEDDDA